MLTVHHLGVSQSDRIVWLYEELEIPYTLVRYDRDPVTRLAPAAYRALHPIGTAPIITDGDLVLPETGAIVEYIVARHGGGRLTVAPAHPGFADHLFWFHFANGAMMPNAFLDLLANALPGDPPPIMTMIRDRGNRAFALVEARLGEADYFGGDRLTTADIMMVFPLTTMRMFVPRDISDFPNIRAYLARIGERPAFRRAMEKADPGMQPLLT